MTLRKSGIGAALLLVLISAIAATQTDTSRHTTAGRFEYEIPQHQQINDTGLSVLAVSPDGRQFAYSTAAGIYVGPVNGSAARLLAGTQGSPAQPFFSPDGQWIGYWSENEGLLKKVPVNGGKPVSFLPGRSSRLIGPVSGVHWLAANAIVYSDNGRAIAQAATNGKKTPKYLMMSPPGSLVVYPQILPDGDSLLYTETRQVNTSDGMIMVLSLKSGNTKTLCRGSKAKYLPNGYLLYKSADKTLLAVRFDLSKLEIAGTPVPVLQNVLDKGTIQFAVADSGTLIYIPDDPAAFDRRQFRLAWVTREGKEESVGAARDCYANPRLSPDGTRIALTITGGERRGIWIWDFETKEMARISSEVNAGGILWTSDGRYIVYRMAPDNKIFDLVRRRSDGKGNREQLASFPQQPYMFYLAKNDNELVLLHIPGTDGEYPPQLSPDGKWIAYGSGDSGRSEVYVSPFPEVTQGRWVISADGGSCPLWSRDGREVLYRDKEAIIAVPVETSPVFRPGTPKALFWAHDDLLDDEQAMPPAWDISSDGKRFLMLETARPLHRIVMVTDWTSLLAAAKRP